MWSGKGEEENGRGEQSGEGETEKADTSRWTAKGKLVKRLGDGWRVDALGQDRQRSFMASVLIGFCAVAAIWESTSEVRHGGRSAMFSIVFEMIGKESYSGGCSIL